MAVARVGGRLLRWSCRHCGIGGQTYAQELPQGWALRSPETPQGPRQRAPGVRNAPGLRFAPGSTGGRTDGPRLGFFASVPPQPRANTLVRCIWSEGYSKKGQDHARKCLKALLASAAASVRGQRAVPRSRGNMQYSVVQFPLLQHLAGMLGHGKRHRGLQSRPLWSGATLPALDGTWLNARTVARVRRWIAEHGSQHLLRSPQAPTRAARSGAISLVRPVARPQRSLPG
jgi:hypothetical protein